jgi:hypothetical protein
VIQPTLAVEEVSDLSFDEDFGFLLLGGCVAGALNMDSDQK